MMTLRALAASGLLCAVLAMASLSPAVAAGEEPPKSDDKDAAAAPSGPPSATLEVASEQMRLIMGGTAGKGTLHFKGVDYPFTYKSASAGAGAKMVKEMSATGQVYGLQTIADFEGQYAAVSTAALAGSSEMQATYRNDKGVVVKLKGSVQGAGLSFGGSVATIKLIKK
jgi:hypothetical protein